MQFLEDGVQTVGRNQDKSPTRKRTGIRGDDQKLINTVSEERKTHSLKQFTNTSEAIRAPQFPQRNSKQKTVHFFSP